MPNIVSNRLLNHYFAVTYLVLLFICSAYLKATIVNDAQSLFYVVVVFVSYPFIYLLPSILLGKTLHKFFAFIYSKADIPQLLQKVIFGVAIASTFCTVLMLFVDKTLFGIYGFHLNSFVWALLTAPGGIDSMGGDIYTQATYGAMVLGLLVLQLGLFLLVRHYTLKTNLSVSKPRKFYRYLLAFFIMATLADRLTYAYSELKAHSAVLASSSALPFYATTTMRKTAMKMGIEAAPRPTGIELSDDKVQLNYPLKPLQVSTTEKPLNIVWLVSESLRADMLTPEIMPNTWEFAQKSHHFTQHYSGGNGTRIGMFTQFYGVHGSYWFSFLAERRPPVLFDVLREKNYQFNMHTSSKFSYPEFDQTIFASIPEENLFPSDAKENALGWQWKNDQYHVEKIQEFITNRDRARPFMTFMFFESPHAPYTFPEESIIARPFVEHLNYATMDLEKDMLLIKNRYINSVHHLDMQVGRLLQFLANENLLDDTLVIITGDHGEEFMEKGRWGHNSEFTEEQVRVPLVLWVPGTGSSTSNNMTSHVDLIPTLLPLLGVSNPAEDYSLGRGLLNEAPARESLVISDWENVTYVDGEFKASFPVRNKNLMGNKITTKDDQPISDTTVFYQKTQKKLFQVVQELKYFSYKSTKGS